MIDLIIRNGMVIDGSGSPRQRADVGVLDGRIVSIGETNETARREIDAEGKLVTPGFIDIHTHYDAQAFWDPMLSPSSAHGVTSVIGGNCGFAIAPLNTSTGEYMLPLLARVEGLPIETLAAGAPWDWTSTADYLDRLDGTLAINAGFMVGHCAIREVVMGAEATQREAHPAEIEAMCQLLREGLAAGAIGFSTATTENHNDHEGNPVPSRLATDAEIIALAKVCGEFPGTTLQIVGKSAGGSAIHDDEFALITQMSIAAKSPVLWNIVRVFADRGEELQPGRGRKNADACVEIHKRGAEEGADLVACLLPEPSQDRYSFFNGMRLDALPGWQKPMALPPEEKLIMLSDPKERQRLKELAAQPTMYPVRAAWANYTVLETVVPENAKYVSRKIGDIAAEIGKDPFDTLIDIVIADGLKTIVTPVLINESREDWELRAHYCHEEGMVIGGSDAGAHLDRRITHNYPTRMLQMMTREHGVLTTEEVVRLITRAPADVFGLLDRGRITEGAIADLLVIDENIVGSSEYSKAYDLPAGGNRLVTEAYGIDHVIVSGEEIIKSGTPTGAIPGRILRSGKDTKDRPLTPVG